MAVAAAASAEDYIGIGIDIELDCDLAREVSAEALMHDERDCAGNHALPAFCAKEAVYKLLYPRSAVFLDHPDLRVKSAGLDRIVLELSRTITDEWRSGSRLLVHIWRQGPYVGAFAVLPATAK